MNDSFLEDLELVSKNTNVKTTVLNNKYITTRQSSTLSASNVSKNENNESKSDRIISSSSTNLTKAKITRRSGSQEQTRKSSSSEARPLCSTPKNKKNDSDENVKPVESQVIKVKAKDDKLTRRSSNGLECIGKYLEVSTKENTRPSIESSIPKYGSSQTSVKKNKTTSTSSESKKSELLEENVGPVSSLSDIKESINQHTEHETDKILRVMQNLHINSQANLIKHLMAQTSELLNEFSPKINSGNIKTLIEENERMREDIYILQTRNNVLQKKVEELSLLKEENINLKLEIKKLQQ